MPSLSVSIVTYYSDEIWFKSTCASLFAAIAHAQAHAGLTDVQISLIDNTEDQTDSRRLFPFVRTQTAQIAILTGHGNVGYGAGHNLALKTAQADLHLVLNPDIALARDALTQALLLFVARPDAVCLTPRAVGRDGAFASLAKRRVTPGILFTRACGPRWLKAWRRRALNAYEYRGELGDTPHPVVTASGAFMLVKNPAAQKIGGFDERFFLHFEDIDFSLRLHAHGEILFAPQVRVVHAGGGAASKHLKFLLANGYRYFRKWGLGDPLKRVKRV